MSRQARPGISTDVIPSDRKTAVLVRRATLKVSAGPDAGKQSSSEAARLSVGTLPGNDLVLTDRTVSRFHAEFVRTDDGFRVKDLGSTNGTFISNVRIVEALVGHAASLRVGQTSLRLELEEEREEVPLHPDPQFGRMLGHSVVMRALFARLARLASSEVTVLIEGETGTGKELLAEAIHQHSPRAAGSWTVVDCSSIPADLVESELFGHERGAFTGATRERRGAFEAADGGTIFLDEIGELPLAVQPKLLRVLEARQVKRVGADDFRPIDVRVLAATHRNLREMVNKGQFREDLYYRLVVASVRLPPLRERLEDLPLLVRHLWRETLDQLGLPQREPPLSREALAELSSLSWDGNVRELRNFVERSLTFSGDLDLAKLDAQPKLAGSHPEIRMDLPYREAKAQWLEYFERGYLAHQVAEAKGNITQAARNAEMDRAFLFKLLRKRTLR